MDRVIKEEACPNMPGQDGSPEPCVELSGPSITGHIRDGLSESDDDTGRDCAQEDKLRKMLDDPLSDYDMRNRRGEYFDLWSYSPLELEPHEGLDAEREAAERDALEKRINEKIELVSIKSAAKRTTALDDLCKEFSNACCADFLVTILSTMTHIVVKGLRKGRDDEQIASATLAGILSIQLGHTEEGVQMYSDLKPILTTMLLDTTVSPVVREKVALSLAVSCFMTDSDDLEKQLVMNKLLQVFSIAYLNEDNCDPSISPELSQLCQSVLLAWCLLVTSRSKETIDLHTVDENISYISAMLECNDLDMRVAAGEAIATLYELARHNDPDFKSTNEYSLFETLHELSADRKVYRAKKDRKTQKPFFRSILRSVWEKDSPTFTVNYAEGQELLKITSWSSKKRYESLCTLLGSGLNQHLLNNPQVRDIFGLMARIPKAPSFQWVRPASEMRPEWHKLNDRIRTKALRRVRDKRSDYSE